MCSDPAPMHCSQVQGKMHLHCSMLLCKTGSQQAVFYCTYTYGDLFFIQVCTDSATMHCSKVQGKMESPPFSVALQNRLKNRQCFTALTPMEICSSYRCALTQHQCTAARFRAKCTLHCSMLLCKTGSQQAVFHCTYTYGDLFFIQVCTDPAPMHCSKVQGKMESPLFSAAQQDWLASGLCHCKYTYEDLLFTQVCTDPTPVHCNTVQGKVQSPLISAAEQDWLASGLYHCKYTYEDLLFIQVFSDPTPVHCSTVQGNMQSPLLTAAQQDWLASGLCHCKYTYEDLLFIQVCSDPTPVHCSTGLSKMQSPLICAAEQDWLASGLYHCKYTYEHLLLQCCLYRCMGVSQACSNRLIKQDLADF